MEMKSKKKCATANNLQFASQLIKTAFAREREQNKSK